MKILAVAALAVELKPWLRRCQSLKKLDWPLPFAQTAQWNQSTLYAVANGPGPRLASKALQIVIERAGPFDALMSVGLCGALDEDLKLNDICCATEVSDGDTSWPVVTMNGGIAAPLLSLDRFLGNPEEKRKWTEQGFGIVEMEAAAIAKYGAENNIPFSAVKVVSDLAAERFALDFNKYRDEAGRFSHTRIALAALTHPILYAPDLYRMASRGPAAYEILGEFLAKSRFQLPHHARRGLPRP